MITQNNLKTLLTALGAVAALSACGGSDEVASPGEGAFAPPPPVQTPPPPPPPPSSGGGPAADCPTGFENVGTLQDRTGAIQRVCQFPLEVLGNLLVPKRDGTIYTVVGRVDVGQDQGADAFAPLAGRQQGILNIEGGVTIFGSGGLDYIVVNRGSRLNVQGTSTAPVVMTSRQSVEGTTNVDSIGQWGGLVILGRAPISNCSGDVEAGNAGCDAQVEGPNARYGGNSPTDNSGSLRYLRLMHSGFQFSPSNELNGITLAGVGTGTTVEYVQVHNSSDDGIEWFGGTVNARYLVLTGNDDDSIDTDVGFRGAIQFAIITQRANGGDHMNEMSAVRRTQTASHPVSNPKIANATYVGRAAGGAAIVMNSDTNVQYYNTIVTKPDGGSGRSRACLDVDAAATTGQFHSVYFSCPTPFDTDDALQDPLFNAPTNTNVTATGTSTLTATFVNGANESAVPAVPNLQAVNPFFQNVDYIGAVRNASDTWWQGWTCGLTADSSC